MLLVIKINKMFLVIKIKEIIDCFNIEGSEYKGILFNNKFIDGIINDNSIGIEEIKEKDYLNGILLYKDNLIQFDIIYFEIDWTLYHLNSLNSCHNQ